MTPAPAAVPFILFDNQPAQLWSDAFPLGNGRLGAMVFGGAAQERIQLNEDTFWSGQPYNPNHDDALPALAEVRRLIFAGRYKEAQALAGERLMARPLHQCSYQPLGDLHLNVPFTQEPSNYRRELDLNTALATTTFRHNGVTYTREAFTSPVDGILIVRLQADRPGALTLTAHLTSQHPVQTTLTPEGALTICGQGGGSGRNGIKGKLRFEARLIAQFEGGTLSTNEGRLEITGANAVTLLLDAATSYRNYRDISGDPAALTSARLAAAAQKPYATLRHDAVAEHQRLFGRVKFNLGTTPAMHAPLPERLQAFAAGVDDPHLVSLYFQFGRYLLISSSRPGTQPANLQGIWNDELTPAWDSKYTININTEMNYWPAETAHLAELTEPLLAMLQDAAVTGAETARRHYNARGWVIHHNIDLWRATAPIDSAFHGMWPCGGAWLCTHLWEHYLFSGDADYLAKIYPLLKGASEFFLDTLVPDPISGHLVTNPSTSPENEHPHGSSLCAGPTMDTAIVRDLLSQSAEAARLLGQDETFQKELADTLAQLAPFRIGKAGQLQEWAQDWDTDAPEQQHRHVSHLYALYPSAQIDALNTPALANACATSLDTRGDFSTGWAIAWRINLWARLRDGDRTWKIVRALLDPSRTYNNLFDAHPPFQIDGNFGGTSGMVEMLLQSHRRVPTQDGSTIFELDLLPALPTAWPQGSITGLRARGGFEVDLFWSGGKLERATIKSHTGTRCRIRHGSNTRELTFRPGETITYPG